MNETAHGQAQTEVDGTPGRGSLRDSGLPRVLPRTGPVPRSVEEKLRERLHEEVRWACPADGFHTDDVETLLASDDYLFSLALAHYETEVHEALATNFVLQASRLYAEIRIACPGPQRVAAQSMLTHGLRNLFESIARDRLAPIIKTELNSIADNQ